MNFMNYIAEELREIMASLGVRTVEELVGRTDLIKVREKTVTKRAAMADLSQILYNVPAPSEEKHFRKENVYNFELEKTVDESVIIPAFKTALKTGKPKTIKVEVSSTNRTVGTIFGSEITKKYKNTLPDDTYTIECHGGGGQSFGAFIPKGLTISLTGDSNDYFGKGLSGGKLIVKPDDNAAYKAEDNIIIGNVALYGATSGEAYINGIAGERFCVRNSGAYAVCEGTGDHGCEYMTGGRAVILGPTGKNFAAGMSGGIAYVLDENYDFYLRLNKELVTMTAVEEKHDIEELRSMIEKHVEATGSPKGKRILHDFANYLPYFKKIVPNDYSRMLGEISRFEEKGLSRDEAELEAFYSVQN